MTDRQSLDRFGVGLLVALVAGGLGILGENTVLFMASAIGLTFAAYGYATSRPSASFAVSRVVDDDSPTAGQDVAVTVTVRNTSDSLVPDVRIVDGVPERLGVVDGAPRHTASLQPGEETTFEYVVRARRGRHAFEQTAVVARNLSADVEERLAYDVPTTLSVNADVGDVPLADQTIQQTGTVPTDSGGEGVEFYQSREYHTSDSMNRVDWKRYARTRELTTVEFREEQAANVVVLVDVRTASRVARRADEPDGVALAKFGAARVVSHLLDEGNRVGLAFYGSRKGYVRPGVGDGHALRIRDALETDGDVSIPVVADGGARRRNDDWRSDAGGWRNDDDDWRTADSRWREGDDDWRNADDDEHVDWLRRRLPGGAQVFFVTPLLDDEPAASARRLQASGHRVRILAPDVTSSSTSGATVERIEWLERVGDLRESGVKVAAWSPDEPLRTAFQRARRRWSR